VVKLRREGWTINGKQVYRIYRNAGVAVPRRKRKRFGFGERKPLPKPLAANLSWSTDFVSDGLADGRRLRCLTVVDDCIASVWRSKWTPRSPALESNRSWKGWRTLVVSRSRLRWTKDLSFRAHRLGGLNGSAKHSS
jgi:hypothetical protein